MSLMTHLVPHVEMAWNPKISPSAQSNRCVYHLNFARSYHSPSSCPRPLFLADTPDPIFISVPRLGQLSIGCLFILPEVGGVSGKFSAGTVGERVTSGGGSGRLRREESTPGEVCGEDKLVGCIVGTAVGEPLRLGGYVCEDSVERRSCTTCPCASMSDFVGATKTSPSAPWSSSS